MAKIKVHIFILLAFLVLLGVIVSPVCAYTLLQEYTVPETSAETSSSRYLLMNPAEDLEDNITKMVWTGTGHVNIGYGNYQATMWVWGGASKIGYFDVFFDFHESTTTYGACQIEFYKINFTHGAYTGLQQLTIGNGTSDKYFGYYTGFHSQNYGASPHPGVNEIGLTDSSAHDVSGTWQIYSGESVEVPDADFACDNVYSIPDADITCSDLSTNTPDYWRWSVGLSDTDESTWYTVDDVGDLFVWQGSDLGNYTMKLQVSNSAGSSWENKTDYVRIMMFPNWTATPTPSLTVVPWSNITTLNASVYRAQFENTLIGNLSAPFLDLTETVVGTIETVILSFEAVINWPFILINEQVLGVSNIFGATFAGLLPYTVVPLAITGKVINMIPWQILAIMTLGLLFDTMLLLLKGQ